MFDKVRKFFFPEVSAFFGRSRNMGPVSREASPHFIHWDLTLESRLNPARCLAASTVVVLQFFKVSVYEGSKAIEGSISHYTENAEPLKLSGRALIVNLIYCV